MSTILSNFSKVLQGVERYLGSNKIIVVLFATLLILWLSDRKNLNKKEERILSYTVITVILVLCPITAMFILMYQTAFYDYEWVWSFVPVTAVMAYGLGTFMEQKFSKGKKTVLVVVSVALLCLCGNQGKILLVAKEEAAVRDNIDEVLQGVYSLQNQEKMVLWAPKDIMQEVRRQDGRVLLAYGRDMWDAKSGAYDYEIYSEELTDAYLWLEKMTEYSLFAATLDNPQESMEFLVEQYEIMEDAEKSMETILGEGSNIIVLPHLVAEQVEIQLTEIASLQQKSVVKAYTEYYTIYAVN